VKVNGGIEWIIDAYGCAAAPLADRRAVAALLNEVVVRAALHVVSTSEHVFEGPGGVTAMYLLAESHLTIHTFPESGVATVNLYCCRPRPVQDWQGLLTNAFGADRVTVREVWRGGSTTERTSEPDHSRSTERTALTEATSARPASASPDDGVGPAGAAP
jgi:S-adenosylmethionine decarboxylase